MKEYFYGLIDSEQLEDTVDDVIEKFIDDNCEVVGEGFDAIADRIIWPVKVLEYRHTTISASVVASQVLDYILDKLDEDYGNMDADPTIPSSTMKAAAKIFAEAVIEDYQVWVCEPTGKIIEYTREEAGKL